MGTVWLKTKEDKGMNMLIPHSPNFANAMYGYINLGAEIIAYDAIDSRFFFLCFFDIVTQKLRGIAVKGRLFLRYTLKVSRSYSK